MRTRTIFVAAAILAAPAVAQTLPTAPEGTVSSSQPFDVHEMTFDLWCQQTQRYSIERCQARSDADVKAFEDYRDSVERSELDFLKQQQRDRDLQYRANRDPTSTVKDRQDAIP
jgi:hypothetical protein